MEESLVREILDRGMPRFTPATPRARDAYMAGLETVRERGFAVSEQEYEEGINAVSAAILDRDRRPMAAIAVAGPAFRLTREVMVAIGPDIVAAAEGVAHEVAMTVHSDQSPANPTSEAGGSGR
jgi:DNA-binding IclR family transcriptional regulator